MTERDEQFIALYRDQRFNSQRDWYNNRVAEYDRAHDQILTATGVGSFFASAAGIVAATDVAGPRALWGIVAAIASGLATVLGAYDNVVGYEHHVKIYRDAQAALGQLRAYAPWITGKHNQIETFISDVEAVFQHEISQWGQLTSQPPSVTPTVTGDATGSGPRRDPDA